MILIELVLTLWVGGEGEEGEDKTEFCVMKCCVFVILWYFLTDGDSMASDKNIKNNVFVSSYPSEYQIGSHHRPFLICPLLCHLFIWIFLNVFLSHVKHD